MALAPVAYALWQRFLRFDPDDPIWPNRDRFVLSAGHASMLLYSLLHLTGVKAVNPKYETLGEPSVTLDDIKQLPPARQPAAPAIRSTAGPPASRPRPARSARAWPPASAWRSPRSGWPRTSTGPASRCSTTTSTPSCGDGCMMEGVSQRGRLARRPPEALQPLLDLRQQPHHDRGQHRRWPSARTSPRASSATAGTSRASATPTTSTCSTGPSTTFKKTDDRPTLIIVDSHIGYGAPNKQDTHAAHGEPLGEEEIRLTKRIYGWPEDAKFLVPDGVCEHFARRHRRARREAARRVDGAVRGVQGEVSRAGRPALPDAAPRSCPRAGTRTCPTFPADAKGMASRDVVGQGAERPGARTCPG